MDNEAFIKKIEEQNEVVKKWVPKVRRGLKRNAASMFPNGKKQDRVIRSVNDAVSRGMGSKVLRGNAGLEEIKLKNSIKAKIFKHFSAEIDGVSFTFARHGIFVLKGAGKGNRTPKDWINPVIDKNLPELADQIGELNADAVLRDMSHILKQNGK